MSRTNKKKRKDFSYNYINNDYNLKKACNITMSFSEKLKWNLGRTIPNSVWTELYKIKSFLDKYIKYVYKDGIIKWIRRKKQKRKLKKRR